MPTLISSIALEFSKALAAMVALPLLISVTDSAERSAIVFSTSTRFFRSLASATTVLEVSSTWPIISFSLCPMLRKLSDSWLTSSFPLIISSWVKSPSASLLLYAVSWVSGRVIRRLMK
ncbi:hypothetical protein D3C80_1632220 [compost metagenome]